MVNGGTEQRKLLFFRLPKTFTMFPVRHSFAHTHTGTNTDTPAERKAKEREVQTKKLFASDKHRFARWNRPTVKRAWHCEGN